MVMFNSTGGFRFKLHTLYMKYGSAVLVSFLHVMGLYHHNHHGTNIGSYLSQYYLQFWIFILFFFVHYNF